MSGREDSNLRPPGPKPGALTGLRYAPKLSYVSVLSFLSTFLKKNTQIEHFAVEEGFEPPVPIS